MISKSTQVCDPSPYTFVDRAATPSVDPLLNTFVGSGIPWKPCAALVRCRVVLPCSVVVCWVDAFHERGPGRADAAPSRIQTNSFYKAHRTTQQATQQATLSQRIMSKNRGDFLREGEASSTQPHRRAKPHPPNPIHQRH